jgi:hypothetical protein
MHLSETLVRHRHVPVSLGARPVVVTFRARQSPAPFGPQHQLRSFGHRHRHLRSAPFALPDPRVASLRSNLKNALPNVCAFDSQRLLVTLPHPGFSAPGNNARATGAAHLAPALRADTAGSATRATQVVHYEADFSRIIPSIADLVNNDEPMIDTRASAPRQAGIPPSFHAHASSPQHSERIRMEIVA